MEHHQNPYQSPTSSFYISACTLEKEYLQKIAKGQKIIINAILAYFILAVINPSPLLLTWGVFGYILFFLAGIIILGISLWGIILLVTNMNYQTGTKVIVIFLMFVPLINWLALVIVNGKATRALREGGYKVGFLGAKHQDSLKVAKT